MKTSAAAIEMNRLRWAGVPAAERTRQARAAALALWAGMSAEERSAEMRRRARKRKKRAA